ncbi:Glutathione peroxidase, partial [Hyalella azteca]
MMIACRGKVVLVVNVASNILAFPCNQFGNQEPGTPQEIKEFVKQYNVQFDVFAKVKVNGDDADPLWKFLKKKQGGLLGDFIKWNFTKFVVDKNGVPVSRHSPKTNPIVSTGVMVCHPWRADSLM